MAAGGVAKNGVPRHGTKRRARSTVAVGQKESAAKSPWGSEVLPEGVTAVCLQHGRALPEPAAAAPALNG